MWKSLSVFCLVWSCIAASPQNRRGEENINDGVRDILQSSSQRHKMPDVQLTKNLSNSDLVSLVNGIISSVSQNGTLTKEGNLRLRDMIGHYIRQHKENFTVDGQPADKVTGTDALQTFLTKLKLKDGDFDYTIVRSLHNEIDIEEEEEEADDPEARDKIIVDYIKNVDKTIAVEGDDIDSKPSDIQLKNLFSIMTL